MIQVSLSKNGVTNAGHLEIQPLKYAPTPDFLLKIVLYDAESDHQVHVDAEALYRAVLAAWQLVKPLSSNAEIG